ncbi:MAG: glycoside hydrolase family 3 C-terminal domain-containing protein [Bacilli bacterium]|nr:glycoside hydrolase family 3 C-terminal domain-containing protein [Bacilli bacterium]
MRTKLNKKKIAVFFTMFAFPAALTSCGAKIVKIVLDAGDGVFIDGTKTFTVNNVKAHTLWKDVKGIKYPEKTDSDFVCWTFNNKEINPDYVITEDITVKASYGFIRPDKISDNGIVLLKNKEKALPLTNSEKQKQTINILGFGGSKNGWYYQGNGSGAGTTNDRISLIDALTGAGFKVNQELENAYEALKTSNDVGVTENAHNNYTIRQGDKSFVDEQFSSTIKGDANNNIALVVFSRWGGEGNDLPKFQGKHSVNKDTKAQVGGCDVDPKKGLTASSYDYTRIYSALSEEEEYLLNKIKSSGKFSKTIVLLNCCCPMECGFLDDDSIDAAFYMPMAGNKGTLTVPRVLDGTVTPSGHLADTFAYDMKSAPSYFNMSWEGKHDEQGDDGFNDKYRLHTRRFDDHLDKYIHYTCYQENIYEGYYWYETADAEGYFDDVGGYEKVVQYPFGYGLSYTTFDWKMDGEPKIEGGSSTATLSAESKITFKVKVTNTGDTHGKDVVQLYVEKPYYEGSIEKPAVQLIGYAKTRELAPGETDEVVIKTRIADFADYDVYDKDNDGFAGYELEGPKKGNDTANYMFSLRTDAHTVKEDIGMTNPWNAQVFADFHYDTDVDTGYSIVNRFTNYISQKGTEYTNNDKHPVDGRCGSIDGVDFGENHVGLNATYLSRADFKGTMPKEFIKAPNLGGEEDKKADYYQTWKVLAPWEETVDVPEQGKEGSLKIDDMAGLKYEDKQWDKLMNQLIIGDKTNVGMSELVRDGSGHTVALPSINKPETNEMDGPSGFNHSLNETSPTNYASDSMIACTWDHKMAHAFGKALGNEGQNILGGIDGIFAPGLNIHRSPLGGRNFEYFSEDPLLSGTLCSWVISGAKEEGVACYVKHVAMNDSDTGRNGRYNFATEQTFRQIYAKPFEIVSKGAKYYDLNDKGEVVEHQALKANAMMASVDRIGTTRVTGSYNFLTEMIRNEWGFRGSIITDYYQAGDVNDIDEGIRCGNDLMLNLGHNCEYDDTTSDTFKYYIRQAAKNILYTYIDTKYTASLY